jgi:hypothetical protein
MGNLPKAFDYLFYSSYYPDLNKAYGQNEALLSKHYLKYGRFEGRQYCNLPDHFNWVKYIDYININTNTNVLLDSKEDAIHHYITFTAPNIPPSIPPETNQNKGCSSCEERRRQIEQNNKINNPEIRDMPAMPRPYKPVINRSKFYKNIQS